MVTVDQGAVSDSLRQNAAAFARRALSGDVSSLATLRSLGDLCRQAGALEEARQLFGRVVELAPDDVKSKMLADILNHRRSFEAQPTDQPLPGRFFLIRDFLPAEVHAEVVSTTLAVLPYFMPSEVYADGHGHVDASRRISAILTDDKAEALRTLFMPRIKAALADYNVNESLGIDPGSIGKKYEFQVTCSGNGAFFKPHTDGSNIAHPSRQISFVYYFHVTPKRFNGGSLLLYDSAPKTERFATGSFTRIEPLDNSIVFFPSGVVHEVERVEAESDDLADGRFTLNGWINSEK